MYFRFLGIRRAARLRRRSCHLVRLGHKTGGGRSVEKSIPCFHLRKTISCFPLLVLKGYYHYWTLFFQGVHGLRFDGFTLFPGEIPVVQKLTLDFKLAPQD